MCTLFFLKSFTRSDFVRLSTFHKPQFPQNRTAPVIKERSPMNMMIQTADLLGKR